MSRTPLCVGTEIDRYLIKQVLSEDGRGISYLAVDTRSVSGAAKVLVREYFPRGISVRENGVVEPRDRMEAQEEFEKGLTGFVEAGHALMSFKTHSLVPAQDIIEENSTAYLVLEWPEGRDFTHLASEEQPMNLESLGSKLSILQPGLEALHSAGLIHTAISPSTLIRLDDGYPAISQLTHVERFDGDEINRAHILFDTPYAAPELRADSDAPIGPWTDVYGLSATCWYLLTGKAPATSAERLTFIASGRGDKLDRASFATLSEEHPKIVDILLAGLELVPERRIASVSEFISALEKATIGTSATWLITAKGFASGHKAVLLGTAAAFGVGAILLSNFEHSSVSMASDIVAEVPTQSPTVLLESIDRQTEQLPAASAITSEQVIKNVSEEAERSPRLLASAAWLLVDRNSAGDVRDFIAFYEDEVFATAVASERLRLLDERAWTSALTTDTPEAFEAYLTDFGSEVRPQGVHAEEAKAKIIELAGAKEFQIIEVRRLMFALGYRVNGRTDETPGLKRAIAKFQESIATDPNGEISELLIEQLTEAVMRKEAAKAAEAEQARREAEAAQQAEEETLATERYVELVREAASSEGRTATGETGRTAQVNIEQDDSATLIEPPKAEPKVIFETKVAGSTLARGKIETQELKREPVRSVGDTFKDCETCPSLTVLPSGQFEMGSPSSERDRQENESPVHTVQISSSFAIATTEVTLREYSVFVSETKRRVPNGCYAETEEHAGEWAFNASLSHRNPGFSQPADHPVICVSYQDAKDYAQWLSQKTGQTYRLPSETEWEYAARGGSNMARHFGRSFRNGCKFANGADRTAKKARENWITATCRDGYLTTAPVGSFASNAFGLHDMLGNVWEWTADCYSDSYTSTPRTQAAHTRGSCQSYVTRGGSWASGVDMLRSAARSGDVRSARYDMLGFRVVRELP